MKMVRERRDEYEMVEQSPVVNIQYSLRDNMLRNLQRTHI